MLEPGWRNDRAAHVASCVYVQWQNIYFWPLFTGTAIPMEERWSRMWLDTWV